MKYLTLLFVLVFISFPAKAQLLSDKPLCLNLFNDTEGEVMGHIETDQFRDPSGKLSWHRSNFRLAGKETREICSTGPFFAGYKLRIVIKTIMPLYSCKTEMNRKITISRAIDPIGGFKSYAMDCPSETKAPEAK